MRQRFLRGMIVRVRDDEWKTPGVIMFSKSDLMFDGDWYFEDMNEVYSVMWIDRKERTFVHDLPGDALELVEDSGLNGEEELQKYKDETLDGFEKEQDEIETRAREEHPGLFFVKDEKPEVEDHSDFDVHPGHPHLND